MITLPDCQGLLLEDALAVCKAWGIAPVLEDISPARGTHPGDVLRVIRVRQEDDTVRLTVGLFPPEQIPPLVEG